LAARRQTTSRCESPNSPVISSKKTPEKWGPHSMMTVHILQKTPRGVAAKTQGIALCNVEGNNSPEWAKAIKNKN